MIKKELVTDDEDIDWVQTEKHVFETAPNHPFLVGLHSCFQSPSRLFFVIGELRCDRRSDDVVKALLYFWWIPHWDIIFPVI